MLVLLRWTATSAADVLLRSTVADVHGVLPGDVVVTRRCPRCGSTRHGAPRARVPTLPDTAVSVSHADSLVVVAVTAAPVLGVGVDVEPADRPTAGLAHVLAPHAHRREVSQGSDADVLARWVRLEAVLKAAGVGLAVDPGHVAIDPPDRVVVPAAIAAPAWWVADTAAVPGYVGAVALRLATPTRPDGVTLDVAPA